MKEVRTDQEDLRLPSLLSVLLDQQVPELLKRLEFPVNLLRHLLRLYRWFLPFLVDLSLLYHPYLLLILADLVHQLRH